MAAGISGAEWDAANTRRAAITGHVVSNGPQLLCAKNTLSIPNPCLIHTISNKMFNPLAIFNWMLESDSPPHPKALILINIALS